MGNLAKRVPHLETLLVVGFVVRYRETVYHIAIEQIRTGDGGRRGETRVTVAGVEQDGQAIPLVDDHREHTVEATLS